MLIIRRYKKSRSGKPFWEYKIYYRDPYTNAKKARRRGGFHYKEECQAAAIEMMGYLRLNDEKTKG